MTNRRRYREHRDIELGPELDARVRRMTDAADLDVVTRRSTARTLLIHLRLPFQLLLAPVFLWGWVLADGRLSWTLPLAFVAYHVFLYGGATAFNSYYDRDEGPIGGLERPPPVVPALLPFSLATKAIGAGLAALVNVTFLLTYLGWIGFSLAYSHPLVRLKARPLAALASVALFQGAVAFWGGWAAARGELATAFGPIGVVGAISATLMVGGYYPLTHLYQIEEDRARGDRTLAVAWGPRACFRCAIACQGVGGLLMLWVVSRYGWGDVALVGAALAVQIRVLACWATSFDAGRVLQNYRRVMRLNTASALGLGLYLGYRLLAV